MLMITLYLFVVFSSIKSKVLSLSFDQTYTIMSCGGGGSVDVASKCRILMST